MGGKTAGVEQLGKLKGEHGSLSLFLLNIFFCLVGFFLLIK